MNLHPKVAAGGLSSAFALILVWALGYAVTIPPEVAGAFVAVVAIIGAWLAPWFASVRPGPAPPPQ